MITTFPVKLELDAVIEVFLMVALGFDQVTIVDNFQLNKCRISKTNIKIFSLFSNVLFVLRKKLRKKLTVFLFLQREERGGGPYQWLRYYTF